MKQYTFRAASALEFYHIVAASPAEAIRELVTKHGRKPYVLVGITDKA